MGETIRVPSAKSGRPGSPDRLPSKRVNRPDARARVTVAISALLYLRISEFTYDRTPGGVDADQFVAVVEQLLAIGGRS